MRFTLHFVLTFHTSTLLKNVHHAGKVSDLVRLMGEHTVDCIAADAGVAETAPYMHHIHTYISG